MRIQRIVPSPGQESVWDYPRPPSIEDVPARIRVEIDGILLADSQSTKRVLETSHPPVYYIPPADVRLEYLVPMTRTSWCEWKGHANYYSIQTTRRSEPAAAWYYPEPTTRFAELAGFIAFYPSRMDACYVGDHKVTAQQGDFYGGWITPNIVGPFKGPPGTFGW